MDKLKKAHKFTAIEQKWIGRMEKYLMEESVLNVGVFDEDTRFRSEGGFKKIDRIFQNKLESIVLELNEYLYRKSYQSSGISAMYCGMTVSPITSMSPSLLIFCF